VANAQRLRRVGVEIQRELAEIVRDELKDPRVGLVTFTGVEVSPDFGHARVFFTALGGPEARTAAQSGLGRAAGFLRAALGARLRIHNTPELRFVYDESVESGIRLTHLIDEAVASDAALARAQRRKRRAPAKRPVRSKRPARAR
jgi:ribosome-binding factor A